MGDVKYLANESDRMASDDGLSRKTTTQANMNAGDGPKNLCVEPNASKKYVYSPN